MKKNLIIVLMVLLTTTVFAQSRSSDNDKRNGFFIGASYSALLCTNPIDDGFNANYKGGGLKLGYVFQNGIGFVISGDIQENNRFTYGGKIGPVFTLGRAIQLYPMVGYFGGQPAWHSVLENGNAIYFGAGIDFNIQKNMGVYLEAGLARWSKSFTYDGGNIYELAEDLNSAVLSIGVSYSAKR